MAFFCQFQTGVAYEGVAHKKSAYNTLESREYFFPIQTYLLVVIFKNCILPETIVPLANFLEKNKARNFSKAVFFPR